MAIWKGCASFCTQWCDLHGGWCGPFSLFVLCSSVASFWSSFWSLLGFLPSDSLSSSDFSSSEPSKQTKLLDGFILMPMILLIHIPSKRELFVEPPVSSTFDGVLDDAPAKYVEATLHALMISFFACFSFTAVVSATSRAASPAFAKRLTQPGSFGTSSLSQKALQKWLQFLERSSYELPGHSQLSSRSIWFTVKIEQLVFPSTMDSRNVYMGFLHGGQLKTPVPCSP